MTAAWHGLPRLRQPDKFWPWLVAIGTRKAAAAVPARVQADVQELDLLVHDDESLLEIRDAIESLRGERLALMPYVTLVVFLPLAFLLWRRNL